MATTNNIIPAAPPQAEPTEAERIAKQLVSDSDLALNRLSNSVQTGFELVWGTKDDPKPKEEAQEIIAALGADMASVFSRHAAVVSMLETAGMASFEPWEKVTAYVIDENLVLGEMKPEWVTEENL
jgi:hypothetical protein